MKYKYKLEIKTDGQWVDYSSKCIQPFSLKDTLDESLATMSVKMYLDKPDTFTPSSMAKFTVYEKTGEEYVEKDRYDFVVNTDSVYKVVMQSNEYYAHDITFVEPIALLQKYTVDNISLTYQLEDVVQYLDTGNLKGNVKIASTVGLRGNIDNIPKGALVAYNTVYSYYFDPSSYTSSDGVTHKGLNEWSKTIYFKSRSGSFQLFRRDKDGNEIRAGDYDYPYIPYCPLWATEYNAITGATISYQLAYDVYVEEIDLTTGEIISPERHALSVDLFNGDTIQFKSQSSSAYGPLTPTRVLFGREGQYADISHINQAYKPFNELTVDYINSDRKSYSGTPDFGQPIPTDWYYWFRVQPNRRYNMRYVRNRNVTYTDGNSFIDPNKPCPIDILAGLPTCFFTYKWTDDTVNIKAPGADNPLQFPELRYSFDVLDISADAGSIEVAMPTPLDLAYKYNCYDFLLKAFYSSGNYKEGDALPFSINALVREKLQKSIIYETQSIGETLYDVLVNIGRYIHAIPYCYFGEEDILFLDFLPLGQGDVKPTNGHRVSIFNSRNLAEYISSFDSYVNNLANNDSDIEEILCAKSNDGSSLVSADNAVILLSRPCFGIKEMWVARLSKPAEWKAMVNNTELSASFVAEESIYNILDFRAQYVPNKGCCLHYQLGSYTIDGLQYKRPNPVSSGEEDTAIQNIIARLWWYDTIAANVNINDYIFKIKYRTYDNTRLQMFRPDLRKYLLNTAQDYYPMQRSFRQQTGKIINSDFYGENLVGELVRTGNEVRQIDYAYGSFDDIPQVGDLQLIDNELHYVSQVTIPFYNSYLSASVIYSKDFNRLSSIVSIPAENRFYEIAERGMITREVNSNEFLLVDTVRRENSSELTVEGRKALLDRIFTNSSPSTRWAVITFKNREFIAAGLPHISPHEIRIIKPVSSFSSGHSISFSVDMDDNYSAGTQVLANSGFNFASSINLAGAFDAMGSAIASAYFNSLYQLSTNASSSAYRGLMPIRYCDKYGNADLYDIELYGSQEMTTAQIAAQPLYLGSFQQPLFVSNENELRKDNREAISINLQHNAIVGNDSIFIGAGFWKVKKSTVECFVFAHYLNKLEQFMPESSAKVGFSFEESGAISIGSRPSYTKAIAFAFKNSDGDYEIVLGINENVDRLFFNFLRKIN